MKRLLTPALLMTVLLLTGCGGTDRYREPEFPTERSARFELIGEPLTLRDAGDIYVYGPYLLVCGHDTLSGNTFHIFDKTSGEKVTGSIQFGKAPGRNYYGYAMTTLMDGWMRYIDGLLETELVFSVNDMLDEETPTVSQSPVLLPGSNLRTWDLGDRYLYHNNSYTDSLSGTSRLELYDKAQGRITAACDIHPIENPYLGECVYRSSRGDLSPDGSRAVFGTWRGAILETYDIGDTLRLRSLNYYIEPLVKILLRHSRNHHYEHTDRSRLGFQDIYAGNERIYTAYDGINIIKFMPEDHPLFTRIAVFDWEGRPLELIKTGLSINRLCCDEAEGTVYAIVTDTDGRLRLGRL